MKKCLKQQLNYIYRTAIGKFVYLDAAKHRTSELLKSCALTKCAETWLQSFLIECECKFQSAFMFFPDENMQCIDSTHTHSTHTQVEINWHRK